MTVSETLQHAKTRFECLAEEFDKAGDTASWAMCSVDAEMMERALTAALSDQAGGWQDISTAPKDGTWILGWTVDDIDDDKWPRCSVVRWRTVGRRRTQPAAFYDDRIFLVSDLAFWQPLPAPPPSSTAWEVG